MILYAPHVLDGSGEKNQVAAISYGNRATVHFHLGEYDQVGAASGDDTELLGSFDSIRWKDQWTNTSGGIYLAKNEIFNTIYQDRPRAGNVVVLLTDGVSNKDRHLTIPIANEARSNGE